MGKLTEGGGRGLAIFVEKYPTCTSLEISQYVRRTCDARCGVGWESSVLGRSISCMSVAQIINHPSVKVTHRHHRLASCAVR